MYSVPEVISNDTRAHQNNKHTQFASKQNHSVSDCYVFRCFYRDLRETFVVRLFPFKLTKNEIIAAAAAAAAKEIQ